MQAHIHTNHGEETLSHVLDQEQKYQKLYPPISSLVNDVLCLHSIVHLQQAIEPHPILTIQEDFDCGRTPTLKVFPNCSSSSKIAATFPHLHTAIRISSIQDRQYLSMQVTFNMLDTFMADNVDINLSITSHTKMQGYHDPSYCHSRTCNSSLVLTTPSQAGQRT